MLTPRVRSLSNNCLGRRNRTYSLLKPRPAKTEFFDFLVVMDLAVQYFGDVP